MNELLDLGDVHFVRLTTFRRNGEPVGTPVWIARDGESLVAFTPKGTGKLKRLAHTSRVELVECGRQGKVAAGAVPVTAEATVENDPAMVEHVAALLRHKYGLEYRLFMTVESLVARLKRRPKAGRAVIRIRPATSEV